MSLTRPTNGLLWLSNLIPNGSMCVLEQDYATAATDKSDALASAMQANDYVILAADSYTFASRISFTRDNQHIFFLNPDAAVTVTDSSGFIYSSVSGSTQLTNCSVFGGDFDFTALTGVGIDMLGIDEASVSFAKFTGTGLTTTAVGINTGGISGLTSGTRCALVNNTFSNVYTAIKVNELSFGTKVSNNAIALPAGGTGIHLIAGTGLSCISPEVSSNEITGTPTSGNGIYAEANIVNGYLHDNHISNVASGVELAAASCTNARVHGNTYTACTANLTDSGTSTSIL